MGDVDLCRVSPRLSRRRGEGRLPARIAGAGWRAARSVHPREGGLRSALRAQQPARLGVDPVAVPPGGPARRPPRFVIAVTAHRATDRAWSPAFGAWPEAGGTRFRVWAPTRTTVDVVIDPAGARARHPLTAEPGGCFAAVVDGVTPGTRYKYLVDGRDEFPDPASRSQPEGVHGPSAVVDPGAYQWSDEAWPGVGLSDLVIYELHVGAFVPAGTFAGV